jgi:hypothetical protein
VLNTL